MSGLCLLIKSTVIIRMETLRRLQKVVFNHLSISYCSSLISVCVLLKVGQKTLRLSERANTCDWTFKYVFFSDSSDRLMRDLLYQAGKKL